MSPAVAHNGAVKLACDVQLDMDALGFEASDDIVEGGGRFVQPGVFKISVGDLSVQARLRGDPLKVEDWVPLRTGDLRAQSLTPQLY
jgi:hypothetical protein